MDDLGLDHFSGAIFSFLVWTSLVADEKSGYLFCVVHAGSETYNLHLGNCKRVRVHPTGLCPSVPRHVAQDKTNA